MSNETKPDAKNDAKPDDKKDAKPAPNPEMEDRPPVETRHSLTLPDGTTLAYRAVCGRLPLKNDKGETDAQIFFTAYFKEGEENPSARPLTFAFNGGPGSSSVWLHLGALGPVRAAMNPDGSLPPPPYQVQPNPATWLTDTDLVFIDPVGTGYSRAKDEETAKKMYAVQADIEYLGEFIRLFLTREKRWASPLYIAGESYGTTRSAGIAGHLADKGIAFSGVILVSMVLQFQTLLFAPYNDLPYPLFLPTYAATAWYHKRLAPEYQSRPLTDFLREVERFADTDYTLALMQGDRLPDGERERVAAKLADYTGLPRVWVERADLRIEIMRFIKELRRDEGITVGRLDSRLTAREGRGHAENPEFDPSMAAIRPPYTAAFNDYIRRELGYETDIPYHVLGSLGAQWDWGKGNTFADTATPLRQAMQKNPHVRVLVASGYYDLATPYWATEYTLSHLGLDPVTRKNVSVAYYEAGHMMYIESGSLDKLKEDVAAFLRG